jgi:hypothetical protein
MPRLFSAGWLPWRVIDTVRPRRVPDTESQVSVEFLEWGRRCSILL